MAEINSETTERNGLTPKDWMRAVDSQSACNLRGILQTLVEAADKVWAEVDAKGTGTKGFATHPFVRLCLHQMFDLAFDGQMPDWDWLAAYTEALARSRGYEWPMNEAQQTEQTELG